MNDRRSFLAAAPLAALPFTGAGQAFPRGAIESSPTAVGGARATHPIALSTYSLWRFRNDELRDMDRCIDLADEFGFDGIEFLLYQIGQNELISRSRMMAYKRRAQRLGLPIMGLSTHQGFVTPDAEKRMFNIDRTIAQIEIAADLGIPVVRVNTGTWGTSKDFDELMANRGIESPLEGYTDEDAYPWVIEAFERCLPTAERLGVVLGLENHWGLGLTPEGILRIVGAADSPWLQVTTDTGNFLEDPYDRLEKLAPHTVLVQAKTYFGGGQWYTLDLDYPRIGRILNDAGYRGWISLEFEGREDWRTAIPRSLELLRRSFPRD
ncbi:MAG: sugar phosphate isomerase/epimerase family protein [Planctomycetota bacterium]|nr:sugar phosphate isomerase/epimerase family protein [Planctomycetota bacterium]